MIRVMSKSETTGQDIGEEGDMQVAAGNTENKSTAAGSNSTKNSQSKNVSGGTSKTVQAQMMQKQFGKKHQQWGVSGIAVTKDSGGAVVGENASSSENSKTANSKININTATVEELDSLRESGRPLRPK